METKPIHVRGSAGAWPRLLGGGAASHWYDAGMTNVAKITVSLPPEQVEQARAAVARGEASSVSAYVSAALAAVAPPAASGSEENGDSLAELVQELIAKHGRPSPEAYAWADRVLAMAEPD